MPIPRTTFDPTVAATVENAMATDTSGSVELYGVEVSNPNVASGFLQLFNLPAANVILGTTAPKLSLFIPGAGATDKWYDKGVYFNGGLSYAVTTTANGSTGLASNCVLNLIYWR